MSESSKTKTPAVNQPVRLLLDTDMGNDIDDALALAMIHSLQSRGECKLIGVAVSKDHEYAPVYVDIINTFYSRPNIPIGMVRDGPTTDEGKFAGKVAQLKDDGKSRYARTHQPGAYPEAVNMLRKLLVDQPDNSVVLMMIGFSTNMDRLLASGPDEIANISGQELFRQKVKHVVMMAARFDEETKANPTPETREYNILKDIPAAQGFLDKCPSPIILSGLEIGKALMYPGSTTEHRYDWTPHHPVADAYRHYHTMPYDRPSWDLTAVLMAVRPEAGYFGQSERGQAIVQDDGIVRFAPDPKGPHRHLTLIESQNDRVIQDMVDLVTQPTPRAGIHIKATSANGSNPQVPKPVGKPTISAVATPAE